MVLLFIDFKKAFDSVSHHLLLKRLETLRIPTSFIRAVHDLYDFNFAKFRDHDEHIPLQRGVRQGDPLSPLLFALYINDMKDYLISRGCSGYVASFAVLIFLLYADDTVLAADSLEAATFIFNLLHDFCSDLELAINLTKTLAMLVGFTAEATCSVIPSCLGDIKVVDRFPYLGTTISNTGSLQQHLVERLTSSKNSNHAWLSWQSSHPSVAPKELLNHFDAMVTPAALFGTQLGIWDTKYKTQFRKLDTIRNNALRRLFQAGPCTSTDLLHGTFGTWPLEWELKLNQAKLFLRLQQMPSNSLAQTALLLDATLKKHSWSQKVIRQLADVGIRDFAADNARRNLELWPNIFRRVWRERWLSQISLRSTATLFISSRTALPGKAEWIAASTCFPIHTRTLLFKLISHSLPLFHNLARRCTSIVKKAQARSSCPKCGALTSEDEHHLIVVCSHYQDLRVRLIAALQNTALKALFTNFDKNALPFLLASPLERKALQLATDIADRRTREGPNAVPL
jgi:hypothetical protein